MRVKLIKKARNGKFMAGGMTLMPTMKQGLATPSDIVDLAGLRNAGVTAGAAKVTVKAGTPHADVAANPGVRKSIPALAELARAIGDPHVRHRGTIGGSIANNDPAADYPAALVGLGATVITNARKLPAEKFFTGMFATALKRDEMVTAVEFPVPKRAGYAKFPNPASRYAMVGVFVAQDKAGKVRVAVTGAGPFGVPGGGNGAGAGEELLGRCPERRHRRGQGPQQRHARLGRIPRPSRERDGPPGGGGSEITQRGARQFEARRCRTLRAFSFPQERLARRNGSGSGFRAPAHSRSMKRSTLLRSASYVAGRDLGTVVFLALRMGRPLFLEGEAGVGKTEVAKVLAGALARPLIRLQCYEGLDVSSAVYEWNYAAQMIDIRLAEAAGLKDRAAIEKGVFSERFLIKRPLLQALEGEPGASAGAAHRRDSTAPMKPSRRFFWRCCRTSR